MISGVLFIATFQWWYTIFDEAFVKWRQHGSNINPLEKINNIRLKKPEKTRHFYEASCPPEFAKEKKILEQLSRSYKITRSKNNFGA